MGFRAAAQAGDGVATTSNSRTITIPASTQDGDVGYLFVDSSSNPNLTGPGANGEPTGWTLDDGPRGGTGTARSWVLSRDLSAALAGTTVTVNFSQTTANGLLLIVLSGRTRTGAVVSANVQDTATATLTLPTQTGVPAGADLIGAAMRRRTGTPPTITATGYTTPTNGEYANGFGTGINTFAEAAYILNSAGGSVGGENWTASGSTISVGTNFLVSVPALSGTTYDKPAQDAGRGSDAVAVTLTTAIAAAGQDAGRGSDAVSLQLFATTSKGVQDVGRGHDTVTAQLIAPPPQKPPTRHLWSAFSRAPGYALDLTLPIIKARGLLAHLGVSGALLTTPYTEARWASLAPSHGFELYRDGRQMFTGLVTKRRAVWDAETGRKVIEVAAIGDEVHLRDSPVFPDPTRAADDQTVNDYWKTRNGAGTALAKVASSAMYQLISDTIGSGAHASRQVAGLTLGSDPGVGVSRVWSALFTGDGDDGALDTLAVISVASGQNLGLRVTTNTGALTFTVVQPRDLSAGIVFSADLGNLVGFDYSEEAPTVTHALAAGQGDLHLRLRKLVVTTDAFALSWGRRIWSYIDRRDTADTTELTQAASDAIAEGGAPVDLKVTLRDTAAATFGRDYELGDKVTVYVGLPGQTKVAQVVDVIREIAFDVDATGAERLTPAIGSYDAKARVPTPSKKLLLRVGRALAGLIGWK